MDEFERWAADLGCTLVALATRWGSAVLPCPGLRGVGDLLSQGAGQRRLECAAMAASERRVRAAVAGDMAIAAEIFGHYVTASVATFETVPPTEEDWRHKLADLNGRGLPFLVCERDGRVAGRRVRRAVADQAGLPATPWRTLSDVAPGQTGQGLGGQLLRSLLQECRRAGLEQVIAVIADGGDPVSAALHRAAGFTDARRGQCRPQARPPPRHSPDATRPDRDLTACARLAPEELRILCDHFLWRYGRFIHAASMRSSVFRGSHVGSAGALRLAHSGHFPYRGQHEFEWRGERRREHAQDC